MSDSRPKKPRRRWLQFSLRTFFVVLTVFCVWLGVVVHRAHEQRKAVAWVEEMGGTVYYGYEFDEDINAIVDAEPPGPKWFRESLGDDYFQDVRAVYFLFTPVSDLTPLAGLKNIQYLDFSSTEVRDVTALAGLTKLRWLHLSNTQVGNLTPLAGLQNLQVLSIENTPVGKEQVEELRQALPNCEIIWSPPAPSP